jgi:hypothetical protein
VGLPKGKKPWRVRLSDLDTGNILFETKLEEGRINTSKRYYLCVRIEVWSGEDLIFTHDYGNHPVKTAGGEVSVRCRSTS